MHISIDIETLGTNVDSQIVSIGAVAFEMSGAIIDDFCVDVALPRDEHINATPGTINFWMTQPKEAFPACFYEPEKCIDLVDALLQLKSFCDQYHIEGVWANGTKFDLGMIEYQCKAHKVEIPWAHNADRCYRTLRQLAFDKNLYQEAAGFANSKESGVQHNALVDAKWQAYFISFVYNKLL